eukprot:2156490-Alexandrium_andersonii.AAC.1
MAWPNCPAGGHGVAAISLWVSLPARAKFVKIESSRSHRAHKWVAAEERRCRLRRSEHKVSGR